MAGDLIREVRRATLTALKADPFVTAIVPAVRIYPSTTPPSPAWPFTRFDAPSSIPLDGPCYAGATVTFLLHGFARPREEAGQIVETAEDYAGRLGSALKVALHNRRLPIGVASARLRVQSARLLRDGDEQDAYHAVLSIEARVLAE
jgi:hypothetical protein